MFTETISFVLTGCFLGGMSINNDAKKLFSGFVCYQIFLLNMSAKDNQETAKATPRAQLNKYLDAVSTMIVPSIIFEFWQKKRRELLLFLHSLLTHYVYPLLRLRWRDF